MVFSKEIQRVKVNMFSGDLEQRGGMCMGKVNNIRNSRYDALQMGGRSNDWLGDSWFAISIRFLF